MPQAGPDHASNRSATGHFADETTELVSEDFVHELRLALHHLYDWPRLRHSVLANVLTLDPQLDPTMALRQLLLAAIEELKPGANVPPKVWEWRAYRLLHARFTEQFTQKEVCNELALSIRQLRREETAAIERLGVMLWQRRVHAGLPAALGDSGAMPNVDAEDVPGEALTAGGEIERLLEAVPPEPVDVEEIIDSAMTIAAPLAERQDVRLELELDENLPPVIAQRASIHQALTTILVTAIRRDRSTSVFTRCIGSLGHVDVKISAIGGSIRCGLGADEAERLNMARYLVEQSGGSLAMSLPTGSGDPFTVEMSLPAASRMTVLVIDDNSDALRLIERCLSNSRYRFVGTADPKRVLQLAEETRPQLVLLDVMLPQVSGWELLARLREDPVLKGTPIIICTILPEAQLALDLGAAAFIRKPFSRQELLSTLDSQLTRPLRDC